MRIQRLIAIWAAKLCSTACRLAGKQGVTLAGKLARKIDPDILRELSLEVREKIFVVCGTNGKTTTNNLLCSAIESEGMKLVCNHTGSNMLDGVTAAFVLAAKNKKAAPICALVALASLGSYWETALPLSFCALMMFAALILTLRHTQREENVI